MDAPFFDEQGVRLEGTNYVAQLYAWNTGVYAWNPTGGFQPVGKPVPFSTNGYFYGGSVVVTFQQGTGPVWVQVRAWKAAGGPTFETAASAGAWTGISEILFLRETGFSGAPPSNPARLIGLMYPGKPLVTRQPKPLAVRFGGTGMLSVAASSGVAMGYQWYRQPSDRPDGLIAGATNAVYMTPPLATSTTFWVGIVNSAGSTLSEKAQITVVSEAVRLEITENSRGPLITVYGAIDTTYSVEYSTNLTSSSWTELIEIKLQTNPLTFLDTANSNDSMRFYRVFVR